MTSSDDDLHYKYEKERFSRFASILNVATEYGKIAIDRAIFVNSGALFAVATISEALGADDIKLTAISIVAFSAGIILGALSAFEAYRNLQILLDFHDDHVNMLLNAEYRDQRLNSNIPGAGIAAIEFDKKVHEIHNEIKKKHDEIVRSHKKSVRLAIGSYASFIAGIVLLSINIYISSQ